MRKIVIIPSFASSHFLKCWIPNVIDTLEPDIVIINEGLFPEGPENKGHIDSEFRRKWCFDKRIAGFDFEETENIIQEFRKKYPHTTIWLQKNGYTLNDTNQCFLVSISRCDITEFRKSDIIFPLEPDAFLLESDKGIIKEEISKLQPGQGLKCLWMDFLETQYYTEAINLEQPKHRRFCYCFDNMENYKKVMDGFMSQSYPRLQYTDKFFIRHYPWFVFDKWKELRYELIYRSDPQYWKDFENGLQDIRNESNSYEENIKYNNDKYFDNSYIPAPYPPKIEIVVRPSRQDSGRYAKFIDIEHPKAIQSHPNFIK